jgi:hypothetical protein
VIGREKLLSCAVELDQKKETDAEDHQAAGGHPGIDFGSREPAKAVPLSIKEANANPAPKARAYLTRNVFIGPPPKIFDVGMLGGVLSVCQIKPLARASTR